MRRLLRASPTAVLSTLGLVLLAIALLVPLPYVVLKPGLTSDTLGVDPGNSEPLITISGTETFPTDGALRLTTVRVQGQPGRTPSLVTLQWAQGRFFLGGALIGWSDRTSAVRPIGDVYDPAVTAEQAEEENRADMVESQAHAKTAAMLALKIPVTVVVDRIVEGSPSAGKLQVGDTLLAVDDVPVAAAEDVRTAVLRRQVGDTITVRVRRTPQGGAPQELPIEVTTAQSTEVSGAPFIGVVSKEDYPFDVDIRIEDIGGPSAGLMFALGIIDKLTPGAMTNGAIIAGTGTIEADGEVGPIGGIPQKMAGAKADGATIFLVPQRNCREATRTAPEGLRLVKVTALGDALTSLDSLRTGQGDVPTC